METFERTGLRFELPSVLAALSVCAARRGAWAGCESLIQRARDGMSQSGATSLLVAAGAEATANIARAAGNEACAAKARNLAQSQWVALGHPRAAPN